MFGGASLSMTPLKTRSEVRAELSGLIAEAVGEDDLSRRQGLLALADHWSDILRRRGEAEPQARPDPGQGPWD